MTDSLFQLLADAADIEVSVSSPPSDDLSLASDIEIIHGDEIRALSQEEEEMNPEYPSLPVVEDNISQHSDEGVVTNS